MTNLKQVTIEVDGEEVSNANPMPVEEQNLDTLKQILEELKKINIHMAVITNLNIASEDIREQ
ncbi:MAG: hypothetical protein ACXADH_07690 [Candidatus Kariarchaeaceae archaeon]|jgi:hypothetical protein